MGTRYIRPHLSCSGVDFYSLEQVQAYDSALLSLVDEKERPAIVAELSRWQHPLPIDVSVEALVAKFDKTALAKKLGLVSLIMSTFSDSDVYRVGRIVIGWIKAGRVDLSEGFNLMPVMPVIDAVFQREPDIPAGLRDNIEFKHKVSVYVVYHHKRS